MAWRRLLRLHRKNNAYIMPPVKIQQKMVSKVARTEPNYISLGNSWFIMVKKQRQTLQNIVRFVRMAIKLHPFTREHRLNSHSHSLSMFWSTGSLFLGPGEKDLNMNHAAFCRCRYCSLWLTQVSVFAASVASRREGVWSQRLLCRPHRPQIKRTYSKIMLFYLQIVC